MKRLTNLAASITLASLTAYSSFAGAYEVANNRQTYTAWNWQRGTTVTIPESTIRDLCGDWDGCTLRLGMYNWDGTRRTASRDSLFYYDNATRTWRASAGDKAGKNNNQVTEHAMQAWACYFTDGEYISWFNRGDFDTNFGLLSWNQYNATCKLTIID
jgi:hypothetical protein